MREGELFLSESRPPVIERGVIKCENKVRRGTFPVIGAPQLLGDKFGSAKMDRVLSLSELAFKSKCQNLTQNQMN